MKELKTKILLFSLLSCSLGIHAQTKIGYSYDAAGNRVKREIVMMQSQARSRSAAYSDRVADRQIKISPNPTNGSLFVEVVNGDEQNKGNVVVYSLDGVTVASGSFINNIATIDMSSCADGVYILRVNMGESSVSWKITKE